MNTIQLLFLILLPILSFTQDANQTTLAKFTITDGTDNGVGDTPPEIYVHKD